jgi:hypothetical protein
MWSEKAGLPDDSGMRFFYIIAPSSFLLIIILSGWEHAVSIRLDIIGLLFLSGTTVLSALTLTILLYLLRVHPKTSYLSALAIYTILSILTAGGVHLIKLYPPLLIRLTGFLQTLSKLDFFSFAWVGLDSGTQQQDVVGMLNKIIIAFFTYLPVTLVRFIYISRKQRELKRQLDGLKKKVDNLEEERKSSRSKGG